MHSRVECFPSTLKRRLQDPRGENSRVSCKHVSLLSLRIISGSSPPLQHFERRSQPLSETAVQPRTGPRMPHFYAFSPYHFTSRSLIAIFRNRDDSRRKAGQGGVLEGRAASNQGHRCLVSRSSFDRFPKLEKFASTTLPSSLRCDKVVAQKTVSAALSSWHIFRVLTHFVASYRRFPLFCFVLPGASYAIEFNRRAKPPRLPDR